MEQRILCLNLTLAEPMDGRILKLLELLALAKNGDTLDLLQLIESVPDDVPARDKSVLILEVIAASHRNGVSYGRQQASQLIEPSKDNPQVMQHVDYTPEVIADPDLVHWLNNEMTILVSACGSYMAGTYNWCLYHDKWKMFNALRERLFAKQKEGSLSEPRQP